MNFINYYKIIILYHWLMQCTLLLYCVDLDTIHLVDLPGIDVETDCQVDYSNQFFTQKMSNLEKV